MLTPLASVNCHRSTVASVDCAAAVVDYKAKQYLEDILFLIIQTIPDKASMSDHNYVLGIFQ